MGRLTDLVGKQFGRLTALGYAGARRWNVSCSCGMVKIVLGSSLKSGTTQSCGCLSREVAAAAAVARATHGMSKSRTYIAWRHMKGRCLNSTDVNYRDYGGRGISLCDRWLSFENFLADMGECPEGLSIDRFPDNDGNYEPGNCRWATQQQQVDNRRCSVLLEWEGESMTHARLAAKHNLAESTLRYRLDHGMPLAEALDKPVRVKRSRRNPNPIFQGARS